MRVTVQPQDWSRGMFYGNLLLPVPDRALVIVCMELEGEEPRKHRAIRNEVPAVL